MIKQWMYSNKSTAFKNLGNGLSCDFGFVYAARVDVLQGFTLLKVGATRSPYTRFSGWGKRVSLICVSPPHMNFWENEEILHQCFAEYQVPKRPHQGSQAEFFNLSIPYFLENLPLLEYLQSK